MSAIPTKASNAMVATVDFYSTVVAELQSRVQEKDQLIERFAGQLRDKAIVEKRLHLVMVVVNVAHQMGIAREQRGDAGAVAYLDELLARTADAVADEGMADVG